VVSRDERVSKLDTGPDAYGDGIASRKMKMEEGGRVHGSVATKQERGETKSAVVHLEPAHGPQAYSGVRSSTVVLPSTGNELPVGVGTTGAPETT